jgi:hypothetical protein
MSPTICPHHTLHRSQGSWVQPRTFKGLVEALLEGRVTLTQLCKIFTHKLLCDVRLLVCPSGILH